MKKNTFYIFFFLSLVFYGQQNTQSLDFDNYLELVPKSPEASAFEKYGDVSLSLYTGTPNISIPVYTVQGREMSFPITLSYDASGIKVSQIATWVGLGWNLNSGGVVNRKVNGLPDDGAPSLYISESEFVSNNLEKLKEKHLYAGGYNTPMEIITLYNFIEDVTINQNIETQPDIFTFSVNGFSGDFVINYITGEAQCITNPDIKANYTKSTQPGEPIISWEIINIDGTKYTFSQPEMTRFSYEVGAGEKVYANYNSSWYLTEIQSKSKKDTIRFNYSEGAFWENEQPLHIGKSTKTLMEVESLQIECTNKFPELGLHIDNNSKPTTYYVKQPYLENIELNGVQIVVFNKEETNRLDLEGRKALDNIEVFNNEEVISKVDFMYSYTDSGNLHSNTLNEELRYRLQLNQVSFGVDNTIKSYRFEYTT